MASTIYCQFKILIVGDSNVGKTSILNKYMDGTFNIGHISTIGMDIRTKVMTFKDKKINLNIIDSAGQERFKSITKSFYRGADGIIFVFDLTNEESYFNLSNWVKQAEGLSNLNFQKIILGNKEDLNKWAVEKGKVQKFAEEKNCKYFITSAKTNLNINEAFNYIVGEMMNYRESKEKGGERESEEQRIQLNANKKKKYEKCNC